MASGADHQLMKIAEKYETSEAAVRQTLDGAANSSLAYLASKTRTANWDELAAALERKVKDRDTPIRKGPRVRLSFRDVQQTLDEMQRRDSFAEVSISRDSGTSEISGSRKRPVESDKTGSTLVEIAVPVPLPKRRRLSAATALMPAPSTLNKDDNTMMEVTGKNIMEIVDSSSERGNPSYRPVCHVSQASLAMLKPGHYVNDEIINESFLLLEATFGRTNITVISSHWPVAKSSKVDFGSSIVLQPIHLDLGLDETSKHWVLAVLWEDRTSARVMDSVPGINDYRELAIARTQQLYKQCFGTELPYDNIAYSAPMIQSNSYDCGIVVIIYALHIASRKAMPCGQPSSIPWRNALSVLLQPLTLTERTCILAGNGTLSDIETQSLIDDLKTSADKSTNLVFDKPLSLETLDKVISDAYSAMVKRLREHPALWVEREGLTPTLELIDYMSHSELAASEASADAAVRKREATIRWNRLAMELSMRLGERQKLERGIASLAAALEILRRAE